MQSNIYKLIQYIGLDPIYCRYKDVDNKFVKEIATELVINKRLSKRQEEVVYNVIVSIGKLCSIYEEIKMDNVCRAIDELKSIGLDEDMTYKGREYDDILDVAVRWVCDGEKLVLDEIIKEIDG